MLRREWLASLLVGLGLGKLIPSLLVERPEHGYRDIHNITDASIYVFDGETWDKVGADPIADLERLMAHEHRLRAGLN